MYRACDRGLSAVILNPTEVLGAYDYSMQWGRMVLAVNYNQLPFLPPGAPVFAARAMSVTRTSAP